MEWYNIILGLHIAGGGAGLLAGTYVLFTKKGNERHRLVGNFFHWGMMIAGLTSIALSQMKPNFFLFMVGVFTLYMNHTGKRYLSYREKGQKPEWLDHAVTLTMFAVAIMFMIKGNRILKTDSFGWVYVLFGFSSIMMTVADLRFAFKRERQPLEWLRFHLQRMIGTFIAALTAVLVVNVTFEPAYALWLAPTFLLTPLIMVWSRKYKNKMP